MHTKQEQQALPMTETVTPAESKKKNTKTNYNRKNKMSKNRKGNTTDSLKVS